MSILRSRFKSAAGDELARYAASLETDLLMLEEDITASLAHARMLGRQGIISAVESSSLADGLIQMLADYKAGHWQPDETEEDIHMAVEAELTRRLGETGKKLHTARSRNDQVAVDVRLWLKKSLAQYRAALLKLIGVLLDRIEYDGQILMPGYTHLQRGQPILLGHHLLAHIWPMTRDLQRLNSLTERLNLSPLGACALAGTSYPTDRYFVAQELEFGGIVENAMDAVASRDVFQEAAAVCAIAMSGLSRLAEEMVLWSAAEFNFVRLDESHTTGSSIMPQKRNPDSAELIRGKSARVIGDLQTLLSLVRSLPLAYNRDLQEDKAALFDAVLITTDSFSLMAGMIEKAQFNKDRFEKELYADFCLATDWADYLAQHGVPFREAYKIVAEVVQYCEQNGGNFSLLTAEKAGEFHLLLKTNLADLLDPRQSVARRNSAGGTAWPEILRQVALLRAEL